MIRVFLADDHQLFREGVRRIFDLTDDVRVVGEASDGAEVLRRAEEERWDVLVLDLTMPKTDGLEVLRGVRKLRPKLPVLILSMYAADQYAARLLRAGASGYLSKGCSSVELTGAVRKLAAGGRYITEEVAGQLLLAGNESAAPHETLSPREHQVFLLLAEGQSPGDIAAQLNLSPSTVSSHLVHIREKLGMRTNGEVMQYAFRVGLMGGS